MKQVLFLIGLLVFYSASMGQYADSILYKEGNYVEVRREFREKVLVITKHFALDTSYRLVITLIPPLFSDTMVVKSYWHNGIEEGPYLDYTGERLVRKGFRRNGRREGLYTAYDTEGWLYETGSYSAGHRVGMWTKYYRDGKVSNKKYYDSSGKFMRVDLFDKKTGRLYKTEYQEPSAY